MFRQRALTAAIGLPLLYGLLLLDGFEWAFGLPLLAVAVAVSVFGADEFRRMLRNRGLHPPDDMGKMMGALPPLFLYFYHYDYNDTVLLILTLIIVVDVLMLALALISDISRRMSARSKQTARQQPAQQDRRGPKEQGPPPPGGTLGALRDFCAIALGSLYVGGLMSYLLFLRRVDDAIAPPWAVWPVALLIAAVWLADTAAFAAGKLLDGPKLWPRVSPGKTIAGTIGGIAACAVVFLGAAAAGVFGGQFSIGLGRAVCLGGLIGAAGLGGDLAESAIKRWAGVKDSGTIVPGHGGVLDRFDSLLWAAPVFFYVLAALRGAL
ncbi:MAG: phosphatidate cytidylyltransferase [Armatimonadota bacterium]|nr:MAG: phosphatidate cytidylyltransferase [Armatimonadota bacterium]